MTEVPIFFARPTGPVHERRSYWQTQPTKGGLHTHCGLTLTLEHVHLDSWLILNQYGGYWRARLIPQPGPATCRNCIKAKKGDA